MFEFLNEMKKYCELILFTAATKEYADIILDSLEINQRYFDYRLYRQHTSFHGITLVKDLSWLGRDLNKILIIDNIPENFKLQKENGLHIKTWTGDINDEELKYLLIILSKLFQSKVNDIFPYLKNIRENYYKNNSYCGSLETELF